MFMKQTKLSLIGNEDEVIEDLLAKLEEEQGYENSFFDTSQQILLIRSVTLLKRLEGDKEGSKFLEDGKATFKKLYELILNVEDSGVHMANALLKVETSDPIIKKESEDTAAWFLQDYFTGSNSADIRGATKTYEHCSGLQRIVKQWMQTEQQTQ